MYELKDDMNKPLKELKENSNRWMKLRRLCRYERGNK
jgi:hypothetical protein